MGKIIYKQINDNQIDEIHQVVVHTFRIGDVEDPDLYAGEPLAQWEKSEPGKFVMEHAVETPEWRRHLDFASYSYMYKIIAQLEKKKLTEFYLRWGKINDKSFP